MVQLIMFNNNKIKNIHVKFFFKLLNLQKFCKGDTVAIKNIKQHNSQTSPLQNYYLTRWQKSNDKITLNIQKLKQ